MMTANFFVPFPNIFPGTYSERTRTVTRAIIILPLSVFGIFHYVPEIQRKILSLVLPVSVSSVSSEIRFFFFKVYRSFFVFIRVIFIIEFTVLCVIIPTC